jgi:ATP-dependent protease HslVU (ClpYQ) peptidase subunit
MQAIETLKAKGQVQLELTRADGTVETTVIKNLVVNTGLNYIVSRMKDTTATAMSHMAIGSGSTAAAAGNTALGTELGRVALTSTTVSTNTIQYVASFPAGTGTGTVYEAGILNASSGGTLLCRTVFGIVTKDAGDSLAITWTITVS